MLAAVTRYLVRAALPLRTMAKTSNKGPAAKPFPGNKRQRRAEKEKENELEWQKAMMKDKPKEDEYAKIEAERLKDRREAIVKDGLAKDIGATALYYKRSIFLCACGKSKNHPLCDRSHIRFGGSPTRLRVNLDAKEVPQLMLCKCGKSKKFPLCDERTCILAKANKPQ